MADTKTSDLTDGGASRNTDYVPAVRSGSNVKVTVGPSDFQPPIVTGNYYFGLFGIAESDGFFGYGYLVATPFWCSHDVTFTKIGVSVAAPSAGKTMRLGIYGNTNNAPDALVLDAGTVSLTSSGPQEITISYVYSANTLIWLAAETNDNLDVATFMVDGSLDQSPKILGLPEAPLHQSYGGTGLKKAGAYMARSPGALPATFTVDGRGVIGVPAIWLRKV